MGSLFDREAARRVLALVEEAQDADAAPEPARVDAAMQKLMTWSKQKGKSHAHH